MTGARKRLVVAGAAVTGVLVAAGVALALALNPVAHATTDVKQPAASSVVDSPVLVNPPVVTDYAFTAETGESLHIQASELLADKSHPSPYTTSTNSERPAELNPVSDRSGFIFHATVSGVTKFNATVFGSDGMRIGVAAVTVTVTAAAESGPEALAPADDRFRIPGLGIDTELKAMSVNDDSGRVSPPTTDAYGLRGYGDFRLPGSGTSFVVVHSGRGADHLGNKLVDVGNGRSTIAPGSRIVAAGAPYIASGSAVITKSALDSDERLWSNKYALVLITCLQLPDGSPSQSNLVTFAQRA